jgi:transposase
MNFKPWDLDTPYLLPPDLREWLAEDHLANFLLDAVSAMDLSAFLAYYRADGKGQQAYHPQMMVTLLLYAYCTGTRSSRELEKKCAEDVAYRVISGDQKPDHASLCRFRERHEGALEDLFVEVLRLCAEAGLVKAGLLALDGTKLKGNASLDANRTLRSLRSELRKALAESKEADAREDGMYGKDKRGDELPEDLRKRSSRRSRLKECARRLEEAARQAREAQAAKIAERERREASGERLRGRKPKVPEAVVDAEAKANVTDPESGMMKTRRGFVQGYNAQALVTAEQIIVAADVTTEANDKRQLKPLAAQAQANLSSVGMAVAASAVLMDAGYWSEANATHAAPGFEWLIATQKDWKQRKALRSKPSPRGRMPAGMSVQDRMERKLLTKRGRHLYRKRSQMIEPVFGQMDTVQDGKQCMRRGQKAVRSEWRFTCAGHNLLKLWRSGRALWN